MKCPVCRSHKFYVRDPDDEYEMYSFNCAEGEACFDPDSDPSKAPAINADTETFCNQCAWHGKFEALSNA
ncbi:MAG: hypothetical protein KKH97_08580 [Proteobacteria bacterium]|nr:hypothetical protein [Pseudomonadota bacterium]MBU1713877.1 hypothetical protein [Pseudomonadota bacterium]